MSDKDLADSADTFSVCVNMKQTIDFSRLSPRAVIKNFHLTLTGEFYE